MPRISFAERAFGRFFCRGDALSVATLGTFVALFAVQPQVTFVFLCLVLFVSIRQQGRDEGLQSGEKLVPQPHDDRAFGFRTAK